MGGVIRRLRRSILVAGLAVLAACAHQVQRPQPTDAAFAGPGLVDDGFISFDGARLGLSSWEAEGEPWAVIVGLHGMNDYAEGFWRAGPYWAERGVTTYAFDQRGFGRSPHRGIWAGEDLMVRDLKTMVDLARRKHPGAVIAVVGVSMGGAVAIEAFANADAPAADRLVLLAPAVWGWSSQSLLNRASLWIVGRTAPGYRLTPMRFIVRERPPTDHEPELRRLSRDPLLVYATRVDAVYGLTDLMQRAWSNTGRIGAPTLYLYGYRDRIIPREPTVEAASRLKPTDKTGFYLDGYHLLLTDDQAWRVWDDVLGFLRDPAAPLPSGVPPIPER